MASQFVFDIQNQGPELVSTNYWDSPYAREGLFLASWNANTLRLLIPNSQLPALDEMRTGRLAVVTRGQWQGHDAIEVMFDDDSEAPYSLNIMEAMCIPIIGRSVAGSAITVTAWGCDGRLAEWPGRFRVAPTLPYLKPWTGV